MNFLELFNRPNLIGAHRGDRSHKPENTSSALVSSIGKCDFIEIDVQLTKDLVPVIIHDDTLSRTSNISTLEHFKHRAPWRVSDFTINELQVLDFGSWFNHEYEPILTLENALAFVKEQSIFLNVEIKDMSMTFANEIVVKTIIEMVKKTQTQHLVLLSSFYHKYLPFCKELSADIPTAALQLKRHPNDLITYLKSLKVNAYHPEDKITDQKTVVSLKEAGFFVNVFTVNEPMRQKKLFEWGVNGIFTDVLSQSV